MTASIVVLHIIWWLIVGIILNRLFDTLDLAEFVSKRDRTYFNVAVFSYVQLSTSMQMLGICVCLVVRAFKKALKCCLTKSDHKLSFDVIRMTSLIYLKVNEVCENCSIVFTLLLLPFLLVFLFYNLLLTYGFFVYQMNPSEQLYLFSVLAFIFVGFYAPTVLVLFSVSSLISKDSKESIELVQQIIAKKIIFGFRKNATT